jgi:signal transduction histidine kinase
MPGAQVVATMLLFGLLVFVAVQWVGDAARAVVASIPYGVTVAIFAGSMADLHSMAVVGAGCVTMYIAMFVMGSAVNAQHAKLSAANADYESALAHAERTLQSKSDAAERLLGARAPLASAVTVTQRLNSLLEEIDARDTALLETANALNAARAAAERANRAKSAFLANMSHELRTPLTAIIGYWDLMLDELDGQHREDLDRIRGAGHHLLTLINDLLDIAKIEAGAMRINALPLDAHALIEEAAATVTPLAQKNNSHITLMLAPGLRDWRGDGVRMRQCLLNLLSNACKFTRNGVIDVSAAPVMRDGVRLLRIVVRDTGCGISADDLARIWTPYEQTESSSRRQDGTGLGLPITRKLAEAMGGGVTAHSSPGEGSVFTLEIADMTAQSTPDASIAPRAIAS